MLHSGIHPDLSQLLTDYGTLVGIEEETLISAIVLLKCEKLRMQPIHDVTHSLDGT